MQLRGSIMALAGLTALAACQAETEEAPDAEPTEAVPETDASPSPETSEPVSILRPEVDQESVPMALEPLEVTIGFPAGGSELDEAALAELNKLIDTALIERGGPIHLGGHSDTAGSDTVNLRAGRARAETVRDWLVEKGVAKDRIEVVTFGEQNPVEPNALPDGSPNEPGRAANRRVEITVNPPPASAP